ncbi:nuclear transport factor 2 family protein [Cupriavidus sp. PET2-C1]
MNIAAELLQQHLRWLVDDNQQWQELIAEDIVWELPYAPGIGHPARLSGRDAVIRHAAWFIGAVSGFRFFDAQILPAADPQQAVARVHAEGLIKSTGRVYRQEYVVFLTARDGRIAHLREYFDPVQAALALDTPIVGITSRSL